MPLREWKALACLPRAVVFALCCLPCGFNALVFVVVAFVVLMSVCSGGGMVECTDLVPPLGWLVGWLDGWMLVGWLIGGLVG